MGNMKSILMYTTDLVLIGLIFMFKMYFDCFAVEHIPNKIENFIVNKNIMTNIFRMQVYDVWIISITCEHFSIEFIDFMLNDKSLTNYAIVPHKISESFLCFIIVFVHYKWSCDRLLSLEVEYTI